MEDEKVELCELPIELIRKCFEEHTDVLRFRSVCHSWRSYIPPSHTNSHSFPLKIPHPFNSSINTYLNQATLYHVEPTDANSNSSLEPFIPSSSSSSSSKGCLIKVEESKNLPLRRLLNPISDHRVINHLSTTPMVLNLLDKRVFEVCKSYKIQCTGCFSSDVSKVVFFPNSSWINIKDSVACCIFLEGRLGLMKHGDETWTLVDDKNFYYDDVIVFKGQFYVTDKWGTISWIDICSLRLIQYSPTLYGFGNKKHLVESCGSLYVVDRYYESERRRRNCDHETAVDCFKIYKLDNEEWGTWVDVKNLGDRVFILGNSCNLSVSAKDVTGYQGNCIYFTDMFDIRMYNIYNLEDHSIMTIDLDPCIEKLCGLSLLES